MNRKRQIWVVERCIPGKIKWEPDDVCLTKKSAIASRDEFKDNPLWIGHGWKYRIVKYIPEE